MTNNRKLLNYGLSLTVLFGLLVVLWQRQAITDWWRLRSYDPPPAIASLATDTAMTDSARRVFYVNHPALLADQDKFRQNCPVAEQTIILGCYQSPQVGIYIYDVNDSRLDGVEQVTAAHEMLHAQYDRLSDTEKKTIDRLLLAFYDSGAVDERVKKTVDLYRQTEPNDVVNEMHSIFGTEIVTLTPELEDYYKRYFSDRGKVVGFSARYEAEFTKRTEQIADMDQQLADLKAQIEPQEANLNTQLSELQAEDAKLDFYRGNDDIDTYNSLVPAYNSKVKAYNAGVSQLKKNIEKYNQLVNERNALAVELQGLQQAIDTRLTAQAQQ